MGKNKKAQVALFVIIAMFVVLALVLLLLLKKEPVSPVTNDVNFKSTIEKCGRDSIEEAIDKMMPQGGFLEPENYKLYKNTNIAYLCQNTGYYKPCINQHPMLISEELNEIESYVSPRMEQCFLSAKEEFEKRQYEVVMQDTNISIDFAPGKVILKVDKKVELKKATQTNNFEGFEIEVVSPIYDLSSVAVEIANQEAKYCYFEYVGYMILFPKINIEKFAMSDSTKIYTIQDKQSKKEMNIAIRSCAIPPGI